MNILSYLDDSTKSSTIFDRLGMFEFWRDFLLSVRNQSEIYPTSKLCLLFVCKQTQLLLSRAKIIYYQKKLSIWILFWSLVKIDVRFHVQNIINLFCCSTLSLFPKSLSSLMSKSSILLIGTTIAASCQKIDRSSRKPRMTYSSRHENVSRMKSAMSPRLKTSLT